VTIVRVDLRCPACGHEWHAATIDTEAWWGAGLTPEKTAKICYCVRCDRRPPMAVVEANGHGDLFAEASA
jgi:hypothetical protein